MKFPDRDVHLVASRDGTTIGYRRLGAGPPVVAIHGGLGTAASWRAVAERLADRFEFFLVDRRGRGTSGAGTQPHSLGHEVDDARAVLAAAGPGAVVIGHSYGGAVALEAARVADRAEISRLVLYEPGVGVAGLIPAMEIERMHELVREGRPERVLALAIGQLDEAGLVRSDRQPAGRPPDALVEIAWTVPRELGALDALGSDLSGYRTVAVPTLLMVGTSSPDRARMSCAALADVLPDVRIAGLKGQGHVAHTADPDQVAEIIGAFLE
jgi:pimeloyl-ACP methyl ester carboxylesterase